MSLFEQVKGAENPQEALLIIARGLDAISTKLESFQVEQETSGWGDWTKIEGEAEEIIVDQDEVNRIREELNAPGLDGEDRQALEARLRLALDQGQSIALGLEDADRVEVSVDGEDTVATLPLPTEEQREMRERFIDTVAPDNPDYWTDEIREAFIKGGPLLLYYSDRETVMSYPIELRQSLVADVEISSPGEAQEMGRDVLMHREEEDLPSVSSLIAGS